MSERLEIHPYILGSGGSARALKQAWAILAIDQPEFKIHEPVQLARGQNLRELKLAKNSVLGLCNPHGLHARAILDGEAAGFSLIVAEKPACTSIAEADRLLNVKTPVAILHGYRQTWGIQTLRSLVAAGDFGEIISIEGRYWQSSIAQRIAGQSKGGGWKNDPALSGPSDVLLDLGVHWLDAALFVSGTTVKQLNPWLSYANAEAPHRDTHVQLQGDLENGTRIFASISKTVHGAANHFEINILGTEKSATWKFLEADQIEMGHGSTRSFLTRPRQDPWSTHGPFHGLGWVEGYVNTLNQAVRVLSGREGNYPKLTEHLSVVRALLRESH